MSPKHFGNHTDQSSSREIPLVSLGPQNPRWAVVPRCIGEREEGQEKG